MLTEICQYLRNWFDCDSAHNRLKYWDGEITISGGKIQGLPISQNQYFRIIDSLLNDGVHTMSDTLTDEVFNGVVQYMKIPPDVIECSADIVAWKNTKAAQKAMNSPYQSESFGGYSYSIGASGDGNTSGTSWQNQKQFYDRLAPWRKI